LEKSPKPDCLSDPLMTEKNKNNYNRSLGKWGEQIAADYLLENGYTIVARNWKSTYGEVDLIALNQDTLTFVEVKTRSGRNFGWPEEAVTPLKQEHLMNCAQSYLDEIKADANQEWQIDVIAILAADKGGSRYEIKHYENAVAGQ
jgi:putative endonuclease